MTRSKVLAIRLIPTTLLLAVLLVVVFRFWYPGGYASLGGVGPRIAILVVAGLVVGPALTAFVYRPGKRSLRLDIGTLAALEIALVGTMAWALYAGRPAYTVFAVDRFEVVTAREIDRDRIDDADLRRRPGHAPRLVYARMPTDPAVFDRLMDETLFHGLPDIDRRPQHWRPYPGGIDELRQRAKPLADLASADDERGRAVRRWLGGRSVDDFIVLPVRSRERDAAMILHARIGYPVDIVAVNPW